MATASKENFNAREIFSGLFIVEILNGFVRSRTGLQTCIRSRLLLNQSITTLITLKNSYGPNIRNRPVKLESDQHIFLVELARIIKNPANS